MWLQFVTLSTLSVLIHSFDRIPNTQIYREVSEPSVRSREYKVVYGNEDLTVMNELVTSEEKNMERRYKDRLHDNIQPLPAEDVKCMMSVDRYCSKEMGETKSIIIQAVKEDCAKCTDGQKEQAGRVIAALMAHDPVAWKMFLTRFILMYKPEPKSRKKRQTLKFKQVGELEDVKLDTVRRFAMPGVKVRVKRAILEVVP